MMQLLNLIQWLNLIKDEGSGDVENIILKGWGVLVNYWQTNKLTTGRTFVIRVTFSTEISICVNDRIMPLGIVLKYIWYFVLLDVSLWRDQRMAWLDWGSHSDKPCALGIQQFHQHCHLHCKGTIEKFLDVCASSNMKKSWCLRKYQNY